MNVVVTGASAGIGRATCTVLANAGHQVWGVARREPLLAEMQRELGARFGYSVADVSTRGAMREVAAEADRTGFAVDAVIANAGTYQRDSAMSETVVQAAAMATNFDGAMASVDAFLPAFVARGSGQFVAVSSVFAVRPDPLAVGYAASKAALTMAFRALALRHRLAGVRFKVLLLGPVAPAGGRRLGGLLIPDITQAATAVAGMLVEPRSLRYYPRLVGAGFTAAGWLPDTAFDAFAGRFRR